MVSVSSRATAGMSASVAVTKELATVCVERSTSSSVDKSTSAVINCSDYNNKIKFSSTTLIKHTKQFVRFGTDVST